MSDKEILAQYIPEEAIDKVLNRIIEKKVHLKITRGRRTKLGDYRPPVRHSNHRISINHDLNPYAFLITFIHEFAHLLVTLKIFLMIRFLLFKTVKSLLKAKN